MPKQLSQDLPENLNVSDLDILGDDTTEVTEETKEETKESTEETTEATKEEAKEETKEETKEESEEKTKEESTETDEVEKTLEDILGDTTEIKEDINESVDKTKEMKETIEDAKDAISKEDTDSAEKLIDDLYGQVIDYSTKVDTLSTKNDILQTKLKELTEANTNYELEMAQTVGKSNDPKMTILNRMYDGAVAGEEFSKGKVITALEDMYYGLTGKSFEESKVDKISDANAEEVILNEVTPPVIEEEPEEKVDMNDITSIF